jgi:hypothetical protein
MKHPRHYPSAEPSSTSARRGIGQTYTTKALREWKRDHPPAVTIFTIHPAAGRGRLDEPWIVRRNGEYFCRANSRDHAEEIANRRTPKENA